MVLSNYSEYSQQWEKYGQIVTSVAKYNSTLHCNGSGQTSENVILPVIEERAGFSSGVAGAASSSTSPPLLPITPSSSITETS